MKQLYYIVLSLLFLSCSKGISQTVYIPKKGKKKIYHKSDCKLLNKKKKEIKIFRAISLKYEACKVCKPTPENTEANALIDHSISPKSKNKKKKYRSSSSTRKSASVQCSGRTRKGNRCKRRVKDGSGRCYQH